MVIVSSLSESMDSIHLEVSDSRSSELDSVSGGIINTVHDIIITTF